MFANDPLTPDPPPGARISALFWVAIAAFIGVGAGAALFGSGPPKAETVPRPQTLGRQSDPPSVVRRHSRVILESQIARKSSEQLRRDGFHRFAVFNAGSNTLKLKAGEASNLLRVKVPTEDVPPGDFGYVLVHWWALDADRKTPYRGTGEVLTDDPENAVIDFVIAEEPDATDE